MALLYRVHFFNNVPPVTFSHSSVESHPPLSLFPVFFFYGFPPPQSLSCCAALPGSPLYFPSADAFLYGYNIHSYRGLDQGRTHLFSAKTHAPPLAFESAPLLPHFNCDFAADAEFQGESLDRFFT